MNWHGFFAYADKLTHLPQGAIILEVAATRARPSFVGPEPHRGAANN